MSTAIAENEIGKGRAPVTKNSTTAGLPLNFILVLVAGCYLALTLINQLRIEWSLNEQYHYGWAVPFLALFCAWRKWKAPQEAPTERVGELEGTCAKQSRDREGALLHSAQSGTLPHGRGSVWRVPGQPRPTVPRSVVYFAAIGLLLLLLPIRLVQEANSDWRLLSWAMALTAVGLGCTMTYLGGGWQTLKRYAFPLLFILVAVPWPTGVEQFLVLHLSGVNTGICVEVLSWLGIPAVQRGYLIELSTGMVEIDAACSGIRSLQAAVMAGLFFGELYRLTVQGRVKVLSIGILLALACNLVRTVLLTWIAATRGLPAMQAWHDPAGVGILLVCLTGLWWAAELLAARSSHKKAQKGTKGIGDFRFQISEGRFSSIGFPVWQLVAGLAWFGVVEIATATWYRSKEANRPAPVVWRFNTPREKTAFTALDISPEARRMLRFEHGEHARWRTASGATVESFFFDWLPGRAAATLARDHTPEVCLPSAGRQISANTNVTVTVQGLELPFRQFTVPTKTGASYLFYCLWEDCAAVQSNETEFTTMSGRLRSVWQGRRNLGQRVLHVGISGAESAEKAREELKRTLEEGVRRG